MNDDVRHGLAHDRVVDITTTGRRSGRPRRIEIWMYNLDGALYISGWPDRPRGWYANVTATPRFTLHLKESVRADLPVRARPITDPTERRAILERIEGLGDTDALVAGSPLIEIEIELTP